MDRAYSLFEIKAFDEEARVITGIASSISTDRMGDIVEPKGAKYSLPMPLLFQHKHDQPVGWVEFAESNDKNIKFRARLAKIDDAGPLKTMVDTAWQAVKSQLVRGVSIGFRSIEHEFMKDADGIRFKQWEWLELSLVTIPANQDASIQTVRSIDSALQAASGQTQIASPTPGVSGHLKPKRKEKAMRTIAEQIASFEARRAAQTARMEELMTKSAEEGTTLDKEQSEEYDTLTDEIAEIDKHLKRLRDLEKINFTKAKPVEGVTDQASGSRARVGQITVRPNLPKGTAFVRYVRALAVAHGSKLEAAEIAKAHWHDSTPEVELALRAAVSAMNTTDSTAAGPLVYAQNLTSEFIEYLRPKTIIGRIPGLRRIPFNVRIPSQTSGSSANWVGQSAPKPVGKIDFTSVTLGMFKAAQIIVITDELSRLSNPSAEELVRNDLTNGMVQFLDQQFLDPDVSAVANVSPASVTNGVTPIQGGGATIADLLADVGHLYAAFTASNLGLANTVWIMSDTLASYIGLMRNSLGGVEFPGLTGEGGTLLGRPVITSENLSTGMMVLLKADDIFLADDGVVNIDVSREASLQMDSAPTNPPVAATVFRSMFQENEIAIRAERFINWAKRRTSAVQFIANAGYGGAPGGSGT